METLKKMLANKHTSAIAGVVVCYRALAAAGFLPDAVVQAEPSVEGLLLAAGLLAAADAGKK